MAGFTGDTVPVPVRAGLEGVSNCVRVCERRNRSEKYVYMHVCPVCNVSHWNCT